MLDAKSQKEKLLQEQAFEIECCNSGKDHLRSKNENEDLVRLRQLNPEQKGIQKKTHKELVEAHLDWEDKNKMYRKVFKRAEKKSERLTDDQKRKRAYNELLEAASIRPRRRTKFFEDACKTRRGASNDPAASKHPRKGPQSPVRVFSALAVPKDAPAAPAASTGAPEAPVSTP